MGDSPRRGTAGQFQSQMRDDEVLAEIMVARFASAEQGVELTPAFFDSLRSAGCPSADRCVKRLALSWDELGDLCDQPMNALRLSAVRLRRKKPGYQKGCTEQEAHWALRTVGLRLGWRPSRFDYAAERDALLREAVRRRIEMKMPTVYQVENALSGSFQEEVHALLADLPMAPTPKTMGALVALIEETCDGITPTPEEVHRFCRRNGISVTQHGPTDPYLDLVARLADASSARPPRPDLNVDLPVSERRRPREWSRPECVYALAKFLLSLKPGQQPTEPAYQAFSSHRDDVPWYRSFPRHGGLESLLPEARGLAKQIQEGLEVEPLIAERRRQRQSSAQEAIWAELLDREGHPPWQAQPDYDPHRVLAYLARRRTPSWSAVVLALEPRAGTTASDLAEAGIAADIQQARNWLKELGDLAIAEFSQRGFEERVEGPSTSRWRLTCEAPDEVRALAAEAQPQAPAWTPMLRETCRAIAEACDDPFQPSQLAKTLATSGQNIAARIKRLEALGAVRLVERRAVGRGRPCLWSLTAEGRRQAYPADDDSG